MPAWSTEVANEFISLGARDERAFDQMRLQSLVYIAHGWCLAITGQPLTGDRPEAWDFGPEYRRLADALRACGTAPVTELINVDLPLAGYHATSPRFEQMEMQIIERAAKHYGIYSSAQLMAITTEHETAPWRRVYADGLGKYREISHKDIESQFVAIADSLTT